MTYRAYTPGSAGRDLPGARVRRPGGHVVRGRDAVVLLAPAQPHAPRWPRRTYDGTFVEDHEHVEGSSDLDEANGRVAVTPEYPDGTYLYVLTDDFPVIPRLFAGTIDPSFVRSGRPPA